VDNSVISYRRKGSVPYELLCVHNFTPTFHENYLVHLSGVKSIKEVFNSDDARYGGSDKIGLPYLLEKNEKGEVLGIRLALSPLATEIFEIRYQ
jgi:1,4-alpha-glucan branching enzyme